ncbi:universal stress protein [Halobacterium salinarum]|uniref:UspA domain protein n=3 Tax=Halobacterium salinarum TaxID=2242 RepID=A0A510N712_HALSA|nr:UspA domain protein [Halobacterium salinarum]TYO75478.1 Universal stress protein family protein [Halobacterium salinarum DSM 3754]CAP13578.1 UspA domain protein [Halobacterium salinarum R1]DAC78012.1 TPA_inf: UspA domain protein [Halobacterium salinarum NRC-1]
MDLETLTGPERPGEPITYVVAFDSSPLAEAALRRAVTFADAADAAVVAVTAVQRDPAMARDRGWLGADESFDVGTVAAAIAADVHEIAPGVPVEYEVLDAYAPRGRVSRTVRELAVDAGATVVFVGSDNAGHVVGGLTSVGQGVSADDRYDVHIVR